MYKISLSATNHEERFFTEIRTDDHYVEADEPVALGGENLGIEPFEFLAAGLASCTAMTIRSYLKVKQISGVKIDVEITMESEKHENVRKSKFLRNIRITGTHDESLKKRILAVAEKCPVHAVLKGEIDIVSSIED